MLTKPLQLAAKLCFNRLHNRARLLFDYSAPEWVLFALSTNNEPTTEFW